MVVLSKAVSDIFSLRTSVEWACSADIDPTSNTSMSVAGETVVFKDARPLYTGFGELWSKPGEEIPVPELDVLIAGICCAALSSSNVNLSKNMASGAADTTTQETLLALANFIKAKRYNSRLKLCLGENVKNFMGFDKSLTSHILHAAVAVVLLLLLSTSLRRCCYCWCHCYCHIATAQVELSKFELSKFELLWPCDCGAAVTDVSYLLVRY